MDKSEMNNEPLKKIAIESANEMRALMESLTHTLLNYKEDVLKDKNIVFVELQNSLEKRKIFISKNSQLALRCKEYWRDNNQSILENELNKEILMNLNDFELITVEKQFVYIQKGLFK